MKTILILCAWLPVAAVADIAEYHVNGETRLYDTDCYANTPDNVVSAGGYNKIVSVTIDECRLRGEYAKVIIHKRHLDYGTTSSFETKWMTVGRANIRKAKIEKEIRRNELGLFCPSQVVEVITKEF